MNLPDKLGADGDAFYNALMDAHEGLSTDESHALNARLVLIMANEIGDLDKLKTLLEVYLFDFSKEVYGQRICVEFIEKIRDEEKFDSVDDLKEQISRDVQSAKELLAV